MYEAVKAQLININCAESLIDIINLLVMKQLLNKIKLGYSESTFSKFHSFLGLSKLKSPRREMYSGVSTQNKK